MFKDIERDLRHAAIFNGLFGGIGCAVFGIIGMLGILDNWWCFAIICLLDAIIISPIIYGFGVLIVEVKECKCYIKAMYDVEYYRMEKENNSHTDANSD